MKKDIEINELAKKSVIVLTSEQLFELLKK